MTLNIPTKSTKYSIGLLEVKQSNYYFFLRNIFLFGTLYSPHGLDGHGFEYVLSPAHTHAEASANKQTRPR